MRLAFLLMVLLLQINFTAGQDLNKKYTISISPEGENSCVMTNGQAGFWYSNVNNTSQLSHMGWTIFENKILNSYELCDSNNEIFAKREADSITLSFDGIRYYYSAFDYQMLLADSLNLLMWRFFKALQPFVIRLEFPSTLRNIELTKINKKIYSLSWDQESKDSNTPGLIYLLTNTAFQPRLTKKHNLVVDFNSGKMDFFLFAAGDFKKASFLENNIIKNGQKFIDAKITKRTNLLENSEFKCSDDTLTKAVAWAKVSINDLIMKQSGSGIFAGLPWFNNYWGRDTFISFGGAIFVNGRFSTGRKILQNFSKWQNSDNASRLYGRIPNRVTLSDIIYNTADGTPWFLYQMMNYLEYGGNLADIENFYVVVEKAIEGALANFTDENGFLYHDDADTWMDAKGASGAWSPRGNRAVEIQILWIRALELGIKLAQHEKNEHQLQQWQGVLRQVKKNFAAYFWNQEGLYDHLNSDGSPDMQIRPNQLFAVSLDDDNILTPRQQEILTRNVFEKMTFPYGVASLYPFDKNFHPWHHYKTFYVQDAAYHNGIVWTWLSGPMITALAKFNQSANILTMFKDISQQILKRGAVGTQSELLDALPRLGKVYPNLSGTVTQAWNLAEFNRNVHEDFMGVRPRLLDNKIIISPILNQDITWAKIKQNFGNGGKLFFDYNRDGEDVDFNIKWQGDKGIMVEFIPPKAQEGNIQFYLEPSLVYQISIKYHNDRIEASLGENNYHFKVAMDKAWSFAKPLLDVTLKSLRGPDWPLLSNGDISFKPDANLVVSASDPERDDNLYKYPSNPIFKEGISDILSVKIFEDRDKYSFKIKMKNLVDTGNKPYLGYDLTYLAILLNVHENSEIKSRSLNRNSGFVFKQNELADYILFSGNGLLLLDGKNQRELCEYRPVFGSFAPGDTSGGLIRFAIPKKYLKKIKPLEKIVVLSGVLDDHGGDSVGEFRSIVVGKAKTWSGGGKKSTADKRNYYDELKILPKIK